MLTGSKWQHLRERPKVSGTYVPINLVVASLFAQGQTILWMKSTRITEVTGVGDQTPALTQNLPNSLQSLTFGRNFNQSLDNVTSSLGLQSLSLGCEFNQNLDNVSWPAGLQSLTCEGKFNQNLDIASWPAGLQGLTFG